MADNILVTPSTPQSEQPNTPQVEKTITPNPPVDATKVVLESANKNDLKAVEEYCVGGKISAGIRPIYNEGG